MIPAQKRPLVLYRNENSGLKYKYSHENQGSSARIMAYLLKIIICVCNSTTENIFSMHDES